MFLGKHPNKLLIENLQVFHNSNFFQAFWNFGYRTNTETFPTARKTRDPVTSAFLKCPWMDVLIVLGAFVEV